MNIFILTTTQNKVWVWVGEVQSYCYNGLLLIRLGLEVYERERERERENMIIQVLMYTWLKREIYIYIYILVCSYKLCFPISCTNDYTQINSRIMRLIDRLLFNSRSRVFQEIFVLTGYNKKRGLNQVTHWLLVRGKYILGTCFHSVPHWHGKEESYIGFVSGPSLF